MNWWTRHRPIYTQRCYGFKWTVKICVVNTQSISFFSLSIVIHLLHIYLIIIQIQLHIYYLLFSYRNKNLNESNEYKTYVSLSQYIKQTNKIKKMFFFSRWCLLWLFEAIFPRFHISINSINDFNLPFEC